MAKLILTEEEKACPFWTELDDATLGKAMKAMRSEKITMSKLVTLLLVGMSVFKATFQVDYLAGCYFMLFAIFSFLANLYADWHRKQKVQNR